MRSLKARLALWVFLPIALISAADLLVTYRNTERVATLVQQQLLKGSARIISEQLSEADGAYEINIPPAAFELFADEHEDMVFYAVRTRRGQLIAGNDDLPRVPRPLQAEQDQYFVSTMRGEAVRVIAYAHALPTPDNDDFVITEVAQTLRGHEALKRELFWLTMREHLMLLALVLIALVIALRWTLQPLTSLGVTLAQRQPGTLEKLDEQDMPNELNPLVNALNDYVARLDHTLTSYERFIANTAHHLRTSFAILVSQLNFGMRATAIDPEQKKLLAAILKTTQQGSKVINQLLMLASVEQVRQHVQQRPAASTVLLAELATSVMEELAPLAHKKSIELGLELDDEQLSVHAPPSMLRELLFNLVDNAIKHMDSPGSVSIAILHQPTHAVLRVTDSGPGIAPEYREKVFERFFRLNAAMPDSSGLGLAIVKEICSLLGGSVSLDAPPDGTGLRVDVHLPLPSTARNSAHYSSTINENI